MTNDALFKMADDLKAAKDRKKELEKLTKENNAEIERLDKALSDAMADAELDKFTRNGHTFYITTRLFASAKDGQKDEMFDALRAHGFGSIVTETVNANTLSSFCKEQIALSGEAEELPAWLSEVVSTYEKTTVGVRKD